MGIEGLEMSDCLGDLERESLLMMKSAANFMGDTLNDVLSMQKIEEGKFELDISHFSLRKSVTTAIALSQGALNAKSIRLDLRFDDCVPQSLLGDRFRIEHVLTNLLSNAIKFSPKNSRIDLAAFVVNSDEIVSIQGSNTCTVCVSITDQGPGISPENQSKLFQNFVQIRPNILQKGQGSGLGLALCKEIVMKHGGVIGVDSIEGEGSTFSFRIPFEISMNAPNVEEETSEVPKTSLSTGTGHSRYSESDLTVKDSESVKAEQVPSAVVSRNASTASLSTINNSLFAMVTDGIYPRIIFTCLLSLITVDEFAFFAQMWSQIAKCWATS